MYAPKRGVWGLTESGWQADLTPEGAAEIFRTAQTNFKGDEDDQLAPDEEVVPEGVNYWFVGAVFGCWGTRPSGSCGEGVWQNGYADKFSQARPADETGRPDRHQGRRFVRKRDVPFETHGRPRQCHADEGRSGRSPPTSGRRADG